jgi:acetolactate synthase-1/2/3 large subunit
MAEPQPTTVSDALVASLVRHGLDTVFGIGGTHTLQLLGSLERAPIEFVPARTEVGAAYMAIGYARTTHQPAVVLTSTGPGALNAASALEDARWSSLPLIHLTTSVGGADFAGAVHETRHQNELLALVGKGVLTVDLGAVDASVQQAVELACQEPAGPVTLDVPAGHWADRTTDVAAGPPPPRPSGVPGLDELEEALRFAQRPLLFIGGGAIGADRGAGALALAERLGAPIITSYQGKPIASWDHELYLGPWATEPEVQALASSADVCIVLGSKLSALGTGYGKLMLPERTYRAALGRGRHAVYGHLRDIPGDAASTARALVQSLTPQAPWADCGGIKRRVFEREELAHPGELGFLRAIEEARSGSSRFAADMSKAGFWAMKYLDCGTHGIHAFSSYLAMGTALPMAVGMAVANGEPVTALLGDGALQMSMAELATIGSLRLPITLLVIVDGAYGILRDNCAAVGGSTSMGVDLWNPDLAEVGHAFGFEVSDADDPDGLRKALATDPTRPRMVLVHQEFSREW